MDYFDFVGSKFYIVKGIKLNVLKVYTKHAKRELLKQASYTTTNSPKRSNLPDVPPKDHSAKQLK